MEVDKAIKERHSVRNYSPKAVKLVDVVTIINAGRFAPAAGNISTARFIIVKDREKKKKLADAAFGQHFVATAQYVIAVCSDLTQLVRAYGDRGLIYARQQAGAAIQNMLLKAVDLGLASCWTGAFDDDAVKRILKIPKDINVEALLPIGYSAGNKVMRKKPDLDKITYLNFWKK